MANPQRNEASLSVDGRARSLRLTLGALAEIEQALGAVGFSDLAERMKKLSARDLLHVTGALLRAGEGPQAPDPAGADIDPAEAARAVAEVFAPAGR